jgi:C1A family cysteine protease
LYTVDGATGDGGDEASAERINLLKGRLRESGPFGTNVDTGWYALPERGFYTCEGESTPGHALVIVGYCDDESMSEGGYWIIKNSWGTSFGDNGYMYIPYGKCGVGRYSRWVWNAHMR